MIKDSNIRFKVEKGRVLVPVGEPCPFGCKYCYTRGGEVGPARVHMDEILSKLKMFASQNDFATLQFGYDGDPFARPERGITMLQNLAGLGKHINFSTKASLDEQTISALKEIQIKMERRGCILSAQVSLSCWASASHIEPHTPTPALRIQTVHNLHIIHVPTFICVRPILPHIDDSEYIEIIEEGLQAGCEGIILGPLYADERGRFVRFVPPDVLQKVPNTRGKVPWSAHSPEWTRYEDKTRFERIRSLISANRGRVFESSADAVEFANQGGVLA